MLKWVFLPTSADCESWWLHTWCESQVTLRLRFSLIIWELNFIKEKTTVGCVCACTRTSMHIHRAKPGQRWARSQSQERSIEFLRYITSHNTPGINYSVSSLSHLAPIQWEVEAPMVNQAVALMLTQRRKTVLPSRSTASLLTSCISCPDGVVKTWNLFLGLAMKASHQFFSPLHPHVEMWLQFYNNRNQCRVQAQFIKIHLVLLPHFRGLYWWIQSEPQVIELIAFKCDDF